jgi:hypothetical protein
VEWIFPALQRLISERAKASRSNGEELASAQFRGRGNKLGKGHRFFTSLLGVYDIGHLGKERLAAAVTFDPHNLLPVTRERLAYLRATIEQQGVAGRPRELGIIEGRPPT